MANLLAVVLMAGLWLAIKFLWSPPSWPSWVPETLTRLGASDDGDEPAVPGPDEAGQAAVDWDVLSRQSIRRRLDALVDELDRLDRDPDVFAKAFHTMVARSAHEALLADASRLADQPYQYAGQTLDIQLVAPSTGRREEMEL